MLLERDLVTRERAASLRDKSDNYKRICHRSALDDSYLKDAAASVKEYPVFRPGSPFFTGKSGFGIVGIGYGMARGGGKIGYEPGRFRGL